MRSLFASTALLGVVAFLPAVALAQHAPAAIAPADEYFGQSSESVLEIRNRIVAIESKNDIDVRGPETVAAIDYVEDAVADWQQKYPADPWIANMLSRTLQCYARAGAVHSERAAAVLALLTQRYPKTIDLDRALLAMWEAPPGDGATTATR